MTEPTLITEFEFQNMFGRIPIHAAYIEDGLVYWKGWAAKQGWLSVAVEYPRDGRHMSLEPQRGLWVTGVIVEAVARLDGEVYYLKIGDTANDT